MAFQLPMVKKAEALQLVMEKKEINSIHPSQVHVVMDVSGSFDDEHRNGYTQELLDRLIPFAILFDKDKTIQSIAFATHAETLPDIDESNYSDYIQKVVRRCGVYNGGTYFGRAFREMLDATVTSVKNPSKTITRTEERVEERQVDSLFGRLFGKTEKVVTTVEVQQEVDGGYTKTPDGDKHIMFFVTDGDTFEEQDALHQGQLLIEKNPNIFVVFVSTHNRAIRFLESNYKGRSNSDYLNLTVDQLRNLSSQSDEQMYEWLLTDSFKAWMNK